MRRSGGVHRGERGRDVSAPGGRGAEGVHDALADLRSKQWMNHNRMVCFGRKEGRKGLGDFECLLQTGEAESGSNSAASVERTTSVSRAL